MMSKGRLTRSGARRRGDKYQDIVTADYLVEMLGKPDRYRWFKVEAKEAKSLDDIVAFRTDDTYLYFQVKFANYEEDPAQELKWKTLLESEGGRTSWLKKWFESWRRLKESGPIHKVGFITNRPPAQEFRTCFGKHHGKVDFERVIDQEIRQEIVDQIGGETDAAEFFNAFTFYVDQQGLYERSEKVKKRFCDLGFSESRWETLLSSIEKWTFHHDQPPPDGQITLQKVREVAGWRELQGMPQHFEVPGDFVIPSNGFHDAFIADVRSAEGQCLVLQASPGTGKSTYLSFLFNELMEAGVPVVRHHYFLSMKDGSGDRSLFSRVADSLMADLRKHYPEALGDLAVISPQPNDLRRWLQQCGEHFSQQGSSLVVIVDGLDHVIREKRSVDELDALLYHLLPLPLGISVIIGTQPLQAPALPQILRDHVPEENRRELPILGRLAVQEWVIGNAGSLGISHLLHSEHDGAASVSDDPDLHVEWQRREHEREFRGIVAAFREISNGHPLHLRYCLRHLLEEKIPVCRPRILDLPACPGRDIEQYYRRLWDSIVNEKGRQILHLLAACRIDWQESSILGALDADGNHRADFVDAMRSVRHLLKEVDLFLQPFHSSILVFVEDQEKHKLSYRDVCKRKTLAWLKTPTAPAYLKWAHEWLLEAELGNEEPLINGPSREWAISSLVDRMGLDRTLQILSGSSRCAIEKGDVARYLETALLHEYVERLRQTTDTTHSLILESRWLIEKDKTGLLNRFGRHFTELSRTEWVVLARLAAENAQHDLVRELFHRYEDAGRDRLFMMNADTLSIEHLEIAAASRDLDQETVITFIEDVEDSGTAYRFAVAYATALRRCRRPNAIREIVVRHSGSWFAKYFGRELARWALQTKTSNIPAGVLANVPEPLLTILAHVAGMDARTGPKFEFPDPHFDIGLIHRSSSDYRTAERAVEERTTRLFFQFTANHLEGRGTDNELWLDKVGKYSFDAECLRLLNAAAKDLSDVIKRGAPAGFGFIYERLSILREPDLEDGRERLDFYNGTRRAVLRIALDVMWIGAFNGRQACIEPMEIDRASQSWLFKPDLFLNICESEAQSLLSRQAALQVLTFLDTLFANSVGEFWERAADLARMALLAARHGMDDRAREYLRTAASNLIAYGNHKDILLFQALDSISECHKYGVTNLRELLLKLVPSITHVLEYTDGGETNHLRDSLADVLSQVDPELLPAYCEWLLSVDDHSCASHIFEGILKNADLDSPIGRELAQTSVDASAVKILCERAIKGSSGARDALVAIEQDLGELPPPPADYHVRASETLERIPRPGPAFDASTLPPDELFRLIQQSYVRENWQFIHSLPIASWIRYWSENGHAREAFTKLREALPYTFDLTIPMDVFELARLHLGKREAYEWLVTIHAYNHGWRRYWRSMAHSERLWAIVRDQYPDNLDDFIVQTIISEDARAAAPFGTEKILRLVKFCLIVGKADLAQELVHTVTQAILQLVSPVNLPQLNWIER